MLSTDLKCYLAAFLILLVSGCTHFKPLPDNYRFSEETVLLEVPFVPQTQDNDCGPAALASMLMYHGGAADLDRITQEVFIPSLSRTLMPDMENFARAEGFETYSARGDIDQIRDAISSGNPVIVLVETGQGMVSRPHYIVVTGYTSSGFIAHVGVMKDAHIVFEKFDQMWKPMNRLFLMIKQP